MNIDYDDRYVYSAEDPEFRKPEPEGSGYYSGGLDFTDRLSSNADGQLQYGEDGSRLWVRDYEDVFGTGAALGGGWSWHDEATEEDEPLLGVGYPYTEPDLSQPQELINPLGEGTTVRLDRATGETLWSADAETCELTDYAIRVHDGIAAMCRFASGEVRATWDGDSSKDLQYANVDVDLVGVDVDTGQTAWSVALGDAGWDGLEKDLPAVRYPTGDEHVIAPVDGTLSVIDVADGSVRELAGDQRVLCESESERVQLTSIWNDPTFPLAEVVSICDADGEAVDTTAVPTAAFAIAGYDLGKPIAINTPDGLTLYAPVDPETETSQTPEP